VALDRHELVHEAHDARAADELLGLREAAAPGLPLLRLGARVARLGDQAALRVVGEGRHHQLESREPLARLLVLVRLARLDQPHLL
tara:strand:- start:74 stop:331 length:258 start_codon:yes stop_codon:yes gene_type:complete